LTCPLGIGIIASMPVIGRTKEIEMKNKAHPIMIAAVKAVRPCERIAAARCAEVTFIKALRKLQQFADYSEQDNIEMAAQAAAAEIAFKFA
jgi:altronate dehydratase